METIGDGQLENQVALELNDIKMGFYKSHGSKASLHSLEQTAAILLKQSVEGLATP